MWRDISFFCVAVILVSCSTTSQRQSWAPPSRSYLEQIEAKSMDSEAFEIYLRKFLEKQTEKPPRWWAGYQLARLLSNGEKKSQSCQIYRELSKDQEFPLAQLAQLRSMEVCSLDRFDFAQLYEVTQNSELKWLHELAATIGEKRAKEEKRPVYEAKFNYELSYHAPIQSKKVSHLKTAINLAKSLGDSDMQNIFEERLYTVAPRLAPKEESVDVSEFKLAFDYRRARKFTEAKALYLKVIRNPASKPAEIYRALQGLRAVSRLMEDRKAVVDYSGRKERVARNWFVSATKSRKNLQYFTNLYHKASLAYARTLWTYDQRTKAINTLNTAKTLLKGYRGLEHIYWILGRIQEEQGHFAKAVQSAEQGLKQKPAKSSQIREKLQWQLAWNSRKIQKYDRAIEVFGNLIEEVDSNFLKSKYKFWMARSLKDRGDSQEANKVFLEIIETYPLGYYAILSHREANLKLSPLRDDGLKVFEPSRRLASTDVLDENLLKWLVALNEAEVAKDYLLIKRPQVKSPQDQEVLISYLSLAGEHNWVFAYLADMELELRNEMALGSPSLLFPRPYLEEVVNSAERFGVPPELVYAIMRQESAFDRYARSPADAFGLMQMLPRVAKRTAPKINITVNDAEDLYLPSVIIPLGAFHLKELLDTYDNQFILAVASYNASAQAVRGWVKTRYRGDALEFIEDIPYEETKSYIKLVLRNMVFYQRLMSEQPTSFPEWCLKGLHSFKS